MKNIATLAAAVLTCLPWLLIRAAGWSPTHPWTAILPGLSIFGASFILCWASEAAEMDIPQNLSIALVALIAVLPEYAVDLYFAWTAGTRPAYTAYAAANMTGANRLLIGIGWPAVLFAFRCRRGFSEISLTTRNAVELMILLAATLYSFLLPLKGTLSPADGLVLFSLFFLYAYLASAAHVEEPEVEGPALAIARLPAADRRTAIAAMFLFSIVAVYFSAAPFAEGILGIGRHFGIEEFLLVQWLAPLASEAPEFIVAVIFALKGKATVGLRVLLSSKVNQWTLLVGTLPLAYSLASGRYAAMPLDARQVEEIFLTSAQSLLGLAILMDLRFGVQEAFLLFALFAVQIVFPAAHARYFFAGIYVALAVGLLLLQNRRANLWSLIAQVIHSSA